MSNNRLRALRKERNVSTRELSDVISLSFTAISKVERGEQELRANDIVEICSYFKCSSDYLLCISDERNLDSNQLIINDIERKMLETMQEISDEGLKMLMDYSNFIKEKYPDTSQKILYDGYNISVLRGYKNEEQS